MFDVLDDGREARRRAVLKSKYAIFALVWVCLIGVSVGILLGKRNWQPENWFQIAVQVAIAAFFLKPIFGEFYKFLKDRESR